MDVDAELPDGDPPQVASRLAAGRRLLSAPPMEVPDVEELVAELGEIRSS